MIEPRHRHPILLLDCFIVAVGAGLLILASRFGLETGHPASRGAGAILGGLYIVYLGALFLLSYFFAEACYMFILLSYICEVRSRPAGRYMAWFYSILCLVFGLSLLLAGLGIL